MKKTILITGASKGVGLSTAKIFYDNGWNVFGTSRTQEGIDTLVSKCPLAKGYICDVQDESSVINATKAAKDTFGTIDVLMNNIGTPSKESIEGIDLQRFNEILEVNVASAFLFTREVAPLMKDNGGGRILFINSTAGLQPYKVAPVYVASKYAMTGLAKSVRYDLYDSNIQVTNIYPGGINTTFHGRDRPELMKPKEVADAIYFVATRPWNAYVAEMTLIPTKDVHLP